jgi:hypothetical protein
VCLTYQESKKSKVSSKDDFAMVDVAFSAPPGLEISVTSVGGGPELPDAVEPQILLGS